MAELKNPARLVSEIEYEYGFEPGTLASRKVTKFVSKARKEAILKLRALGLSWPEIAQTLQRDHTSVMRMINPLQAKKTKKK